MIAKIGDIWGPALPSHMAKVAQILKDEIPKYKTHILDVLFQSVLTLPTKTPVYGTLLGLLSCSVGDLGTEVLDRINEELKVALRRFEIYNIKYLVRFLGELMNANVVEQTCLFETFEKLLCFEETHPQGLTDHLVMIVMSTLPYVGNCLFLHDPSRLASLMENIKKYIANRNLDPNQCVAVFTDKPPVPYLQWLYEALEENSKKNWTNSPLILTPHNTFTEQLNTIKRATFDTTSLEIPLPFTTDNYSYPPPKNIFRIFEGESLPLWQARTISNLDRFVIEDYIVDVLYFFNADPKECAKQVANIPINIKIESVLDIVIETIFSELFTLPNPAFNRTFYAYLISELFKTFKDIMVGALAKTVTNLFQRINHLDVEIYFIFTEWFGVHLSNFDYKWLWGQWVKVPTEQHGHFVSEVLDRCIRLSYYERLEKALPKELAFRLPEKVRPNFKYIDDPSLEGYETARQLYQKMRNRESSEAIIKWLESDSCPLSIPPSESKLEDSENPKSLSRNLLIVDMALSCLLEIGSKSISHLLVSMERYLGLFRHYIRDQNTFLQAVVSTVNFWKYSPQRINISISLFIRSRIIPPSAIIEWIFSTEIENQSNMYKNQWIWELLFSTIDNTKQTIHLLRRKLNDLENPKQNPNATDDEREAYKKCEDNLAAALQEQKEFFLLLFQKFENMLQNTKEREQNEETIINVASTVENPETDAKIPKYTYILALGVFKAIGRKYYTNIRSLQQTLDYLLGTADPEVRQIYLLFKSLLTLY
uniref:MIF4G domain-containing protein n=1 Tax=Arcella intermedia TaxID=1963864 RepID=A0A6B2KXX1_9EUKA